MMCPVRLMIRKPVKARMVSMLDVWGKPMITCLAEK